MTRALAEEVKRRAFRELRQRDEEGSFLELNYRQKQAFREEDVGLVRPILDQRLKRTKAYALVDGPPRSPSCSLSGCTSNCTGGRVQRKRKVCGRRLG